MVQLPPGDPYAKALLLGIAFSNNIGGMTTPIASPQNVVRAREPAGDLLDVLGLEVTVEMKAGRSFGTISSRCEVGRLSVIFLS
jgi:hypothetical protein